MLSLEPPKNEARITTVSVRSSDLEPFLDAARGAGWRAEDTGERVATEEGPDAEAVVLLAFPTERRRPAGRLRWPAEVPR